MTTERRPGLPSSSIKRVKKDRLGDNFTRPSTAQQAVLAELRRAILEGELAPGTRIVLDTIAERMGLSRVPVREALKLLEGEGQITYVAHRGYFVTQLELAELIDVYHIRGLLESDVVPMAVPRLVAEDLITMRDANETILKAASSGDISGVIAANRLFHFTLFSASGRARIVSMIRQLWDSSEPYRAVYFGEESNLQLVYSEHNAILDAARAADAVLVNELLTEHRMHAVGRLRSVLNQDQGGESPEA